MFIFSEVKTIYPEVKTILKAKQRSKWRHEHPRYNKADPDYMLTRQELLLLHRSTAVQVTTSVPLMPQNQPSGRGLLPSPTTWSPDQHLAAMLADVSRYILGRTKGCGLGVWSACPHSHREVSEMPVLFTWALRPQCPVRRRKIVVCWACSSLQTGSRCAWYPPFSFFQSPLYREQRSVLASL